MWRPETANGERFTGDSAMADNDHPRREIVPVEFNAATGVAIYHVDQPVHYCPTDQTSFGQTGETARFVEKAVLTINGALRDHSSRICARSAAALAAFSFRTSASRLVTISTMLGPAAGFSRPIPNTAKAPAIVCAPSSAPVRRAWA